MVILSLLPFFLPSAPAPSGSPQLALASACGEPATPIHAIQGAGNASPEVGRRHTLEGVVVGDFQDPENQLGGFFLQEEDRQIDANPFTSEGLFVHDNGFGVPIVPGQLLRVEGQVAELAGLTALVNLTSLVVCGSAPASPVLLVLPVSTLSGWERFEGMQVTFPQRLYVSETSFLGRTGEIRLSVNGRQYAPTQLAEPGDPALSVLDLLLRSSLQLDDGSRLETPLPLPPFLGAGQTLRVGDSIAGLTGVLGFDDDHYEIHATGKTAFVQANPRPPAPVPTSLLKVASFNVLYYFTTIDDGASRCGPLEDQKCKGADSPAELARQRDKLIRTLVTLDADIVGLIEVENNPSRSVQDLVAGLNAVLGAGTYAYLDTGMIGNFVIKNALIYKPARVMPVGAHAILDSSIDPDFLDTYNRPSLAQTFRDRSGEHFTVVVNHFKSKGSTCAEVGDPDTGDGQRHCNLTRTRAAQALVEWLARDPTASQDPDVLILGDLNSYLMEDPIDVLTGAGYTNLVQAYQGSQDYSYVAAGLSGSLDYALANSSLASRVRSAAIWHTNADEPPALDYNDTNQPALYQADAFRASDHDPLLVSLDFSAQHQFYLPVVSGAE